MESMCEDVLMHTLLHRQKLHSLYQVAFFEQHSDVLDRLTAAAEILEDACHGSGNVHQAQEKMMQEMQSLNIQAKMCQFDKLIRTVANHYLLSCGSTCK